LDIVLAISEIMTRTVVTCSPEDDLGKAASLMWDYDCGSIPVLNDSGQVVGMLTDRDICMAAFTQAKRLPEIHVEEAMSWDVYACLPDDSIAEAEDIMRNRMVRRLPVIDLEGRLVGVISLNDFAREAAREQSRRTRETTPADVGLTLAAICQPRTSRQVPIS
jgi:CBS domain-containing protein